MLLDDLGNPADVSPLAGDLRQRREEVMMPPADPPQVTNGRQRPIGLLDLPAHPQHAGQRHEKRLAHEPLGHSS